MTTSTAVAEAVAACADKAAARVGAGPDYARAWAAGWLEAAELAVDLLEEYRAAGRAEMADTAAAVVADSPAALIAALIAAAPRRKRILREGGQIVEIVEEPA
jgi:hypothetical protein